MAYEYFYEGTPYSLDPSYGDLFVGYRSPAKTLSITTDSRTANQIQEVSNKLNLGVKQVEVSLVSPEVFDAVPKQQLTEINRLSKLTNSEMSVHGPIVEPSGISKQGYSEESREAVERQMQMAVDRSHELNPNGNIPVVFHSSGGIPGTEYAVPSEELIKEYKEQFKAKVGREPTAAEMNRLAENQIGIINQETNQIVGAKREIKYYPEVGKEIRTPREEVGTINHTEWTNSITNLAFYKKEADETLKSAHAVLAPLIAMKEQGEKIRLENLDVRQKQALTELGKTELFLENVEASFRTLYNKAYKYSEDPNTRTFLEKEIAKPWKDNLEEMREKRRGDFLDGFDMVVKKSFLIDETLNKLKLIGEPVKLPSGESIILREPQVYKPIEDFAIDKTSKTFGDVAFNAYKQFGDNAPMVVVENPPSGMGLSRAEDLKKIIEASRKQFIENAAEQGISRKKAEDAAKKLIGATWDVGHINMLRRYGFEEKDIIKETEKIAPYVKHVHLSDNFGFEHTELPMGMGNVPTKAIMEKLEQAGFKGKKVVEAISWWQHMKTPPINATLEAFGSPMYLGRAMAPYWNQAASTYGSYFSGYGPFLPEQHFSMYGAGFSGMPVELGGQMPGKASRLSGTPNE